MYLTREEFAKIRPLQWTTRQYLDTLYNTTSTETDTALFWYDFLRYVLAPKYKRQWAIVSLQRFDQTQPVLLTNDLRLKLPSSLETIVYYADFKDTYPIKWTIPIKQSTIIYISGALIVLLLLVSVIVPKRYIDYDRLI